MRQFIAPVSVVRAFPLLLALCAVFASAQASSGAAPVVVPNVSIFYYPWYGTPRPTAAGCTGRARIRPRTSRPTSTRPAASTRARTRRVVRAQMQEIAGAGIQEVVSSWWGWGSPEDRRLPLVIRRPRRWRSSASPSISSRTPAATIATRRVGHRAPGAARDHAVLRLPARSTSRAPTGRALRSKPPRDPALRADDRWSDTQPRPISTAIYTYDILLFGGDTFDRFCKAAHSSSCSCLPSVGPGYDATRATGDLRIKPRRDGKTYDSMWRAAIHVEAGRRDDHELQRVARGDADRAGPRHGRPGTPPTLDRTRATKARTGSHGKAAERAYLDRTRFWVRAFARLANARTFSSDQDLDEDVGAAAEDERVEHVALDDAAQRRWPRSTVASGHSSRPSAAAPSSEPK